MIQETNINDPMKSVKDATLADFYQNIINELGKFAPFMSSLWLIYSFGKANKRLYYISFLILNIVINIILKLLIKDKRPLKECQNLDITISNLEFDKYGFPSGHSQIAFFNFLVSIGSKNYEDVIFFILFLITVFQRYNSKCHTILQIIGGILVSIFIYLFF